MEYGERSQFVCSPLCACSCARSLAFALFLSLAPPLLLLLLFFSLFSFLFSSLLLFFPFFFFPVGQSLVLITQECEGHMHMPLHAYERQVLVLLTLEVRCDYARQTFLALTSSFG